MKYFFTFLVFFFLALILLYTIRQTERLRQVEALKPFYKSMIESNLKCISLSYFQWDAMYNAIEMNLQGRLQEYFDELTFYYAYVENVQIEPVEKVDFEIYQISSEEGKLNVLFKVYNDDKTEYIKDKAVSAIINPQIILESLMIDWIKISPVGKDFVFGLKYVPTRSVIDVTCVLGSFLIAVLSIFYVLFNETRSKLKMIRRSKKEEEIEREINQTVLELSVNLLKHYENEEVYQKMLEKMIQVMPNAEGGSVLIKRDNRFEYVAAVGFDLKELSKIYFDDKTERRWIRPPYALKKRDDIRAIYKEADPALLSLLRTAGRIDEIKCTVSVPIEIEGEVVAIINFDNFADENAFDERSVELAMLFANYLGVIFERIKLEKKIKEQNEEMAYLSARDPLTGLLNRRSFKEYAEKLLSLAKRENKRVSLFFIDLKDFKQVNDKYGHVFGDQVLEIIASRIEKSVRSSDVVARFGGDEFVVLAYNCTRHDSTNLAEKMAQSIEEPVEYEGRTISVGVNIGIAVYPEDGQDIDELIKLADIAMYNAKMKNQTYSLNGQMNQI
ncbi:MAG: GGDEF domain-containing protein [Pseudothermotoga sp.]